MSSAAANSGVHRHLVAVPFPGRGHINPMLNLCKLIASKSPHLLITVMVTEEWRGFLAGGSEPEWPANLRLGAVAQVIPSEVGRAGDYSGFIEAVMTKLEAPFEELLDRLEPPATTILYDVGLPWAVEVANRRGIPAAALSTVSASMLSLLSHFDLLVQNGHFPYDVASNANKSHGHEPSPPLTTTTTNRPATKPPSPMSSAAANSAVRRHLVAVPFPGRGHINPMLNLCKLIASKSPHLLITVMVTEEWRGFLAGGAEPAWPANLRLGAVAQVIPSEVGRAGKFPAFIEAAMTKLEAPFEELLDRLEPPATAILYDTYLFWAVKVANRRRIPAAALSTTSASVFNLLSHFDLLVQNGHFPLDDSERGSEVIDYIPGLPPTAISDFPTIFSGDGNKVLSRVLESLHHIPNAQFLLLTSIPDLEGSAIEALKSRFPTTTVLPIGPMIPYFNHPPPITAGSDHYLRWLDRQPDESVLYISMGSFLSTSAAQMAEIVAGVLDSGVRHLWVTRGEEERLKGGEERGCLVGWCDQFRVLSHRAVGGFWSHCGWNSTSEAAFTATPVLTCPIFWDQRLNGKMVAEDWRFGRRVREVGKEGLITREEIKRIVGEFMDVAGEGRREMAATAGRVSQAYRRAVAGGGTAAGNIDAFVEEISRVS